MVRAFAFIKMFVFTATDLDRRKYAFDMLRLDIAIHIKIFLGFLTFPIKLTSSEHLALVFRVIANTIGYDIIIKMKVFLITHF